MQMPLSMRVPFLDLTRIIHDALETSTVCHNSNPHPDPPAPRLRRAGPLPWKGRGEISSTRVRGSRVRETPPSCAAKDQSRSERDQGEGQFVAQNFMNRSG